MPRWLPVLAVLLVAGLARAFDASSPVGLWKTIDDSTGRQKGLVELYLEGGELKGRIVKTFPAPGASDNPMCDKCQGERKGKPMIGMVFLWGMKPDGAEWKGGEILDPNNGKVYSAKLEPADGGRKLKVRGFLGISLLGRTQVWVREK